MRTAAEDRTAVDAGMMRAITDDAAKAEKIAQMMRALGNPSRVRILALLCERDEANVGEIAEALGLRQSVTSEHLSALRAGGQVRVAPRDGHRYYSVALPELRVLMSCVAGCCKQLHGAR